ncbi:MAG TPA: hypothetical protein VMU05_14975 [Dongiaceae bacterium]|nr:hypothetical protein [Dongiaceae bacterium]
MARVEISKNNYRAFATVNDIRGTFREHRVELEWLAYFITGDQTMAKECVSDACLLSEGHNGVFRQWLLTWARHATIRSAIETQHDRIKEAARKYDRTGFVQCTREPLKQDAIETLVRCSDSFIARLDVLSRTALVICGIQNSPIADAALMLGISRSVASAAYCGALDCLEAVPCEHLTKQNETQLNI